jgi:parallel beta-helix repeat protein
MPFTGRLLPLSAALTLLVATLLTAPARADAATLNVALHGTDSPSCGSASAPCRSITQALANADAGDKIVVGPGTYPSIGPAACACALLVDKAVTIESREGAHVTIIEPLAATLRVVAIAASGVTFGRSGRGFTVRGGQNDGVAASGVTGLVIAGNVARDNGIDGFTLANVEGYQISDNLSIGHGSDGFSDNQGTDGRYERNVAIGNTTGFRLSGSSSTKVADNVARDNTQTGFVIGFATALELTRNGAHGNGGEGFIVSAGFGAPTSCRNNAATANGGSGFRVSGGPDLLVADNVASGNDIGIEIVSTTAGVFTGNTVTGNVTGWSVANPATVVEIRRNAIVGNAGDGLLIFNDTSTVTQNNIFGNGACGLNNSSGTSLAVPQNFWGASAGPGPDPADVVCNTGAGSATTVTPVAKKPFNITVDTAQ